VKGDICTIICSFTSYNSWTIFRVV